MDNLTHSLAAVLVADAVCDRRLPDAWTGKSPFRTAALWVSLLANNLPDLDFAYRAVTPGKLGYLLHHRGHTHTVVGALALSLVALGVVLGVARRRRVVFDRKDVRALAALAVFGSLLHIAMDYQNNYGVHPFWPFDDRWYYGDVLFIVEPLLCVVGLVVIAFCSRTKVARVALAALLVAVLVAGAFLRAVPAAEIMGLAVFSGALAFVARALSRRGRLLLGLMAWLVVTAVFAVGGHAAGALARASTARLFPRTRVADLIRTPVPGNPLCWSVIALGTEDDAYIARRGAVSLAPSLVSPARCASTEPRTGTARLDAIETTDGAVLFRSEYRMPLADLRRVDRERCDAAAFLRYARAPFYDPGPPSVIGDLRFDRRRGLEFAELELSSSSVCPPHVPPWTPPRADLLGD